MARLTPPRDPITIHFDGAPVVADRGEPAAVALVAGGHLVLARSPKFHRPRGPSCLRGACDGCLARVDDVPNIMTCRVPVTPGMCIETQNVVGSGQTDLLRAADWFFPEGMNHHELLAGVPGMQRILQGVARRVSGLGKLPKEAAAPTSATRRRVDVLVVGAGPAGMAVAVELAKRGRPVEVIDDALAWGGSLRALPFPEQEVALPGEGSWRSLSSAFEDAIGAARIVVRMRTTAAGVYGDEVLVANDTQVEVVTARTLVLAPGAHDGTLAFEGNDLPGVMSARAACFFLTHGVSVGKRIVVAVTDAGGPFGAAFGRAVQDAVLVHGAPVRTRGSARLREVTFAGDRGSDERRLACDALLLDAPRSPAYELCAQAGAQLAHEPRGFVVNAPGGQIRKGVFAAGEAVGTPFEPAAILREAAELAERAMDG
jgi:sarcosine oxidase subunit alpha